MPGGINTGCGGPQDNYFYRGTIQIVLLQNQANQLKTDLLNNLPIAQLIAETQALQANIGNGVTITPQAYAYLQEAQSHCQDLVNDLNNANKYIDNVDYQGYYNPCLDDGDRIILQLFWANQVNTNQNQGV